MFNGLARLLGQAGAGIGQAVQGAEHVAQGALGTINPQWGPNEPQDIAAQRGEVNLARARAMQYQQQNNGKVNGYQPQPGQHDAAVRYAANPASFNGSGIDPRIFGYPADNSVRPGLQVQPNISGTAGNWNGNPQELQGYYGNMQGYNQNDLSNGIQGGMVNQGYIPLQNSNQVGNIQGNQSPFQRLTGQQ